MGCYVLAFRCASVNEASGWRRRGGLAKLCSQTAYLLDRLHQGQMALNDHGSFCDASQLGSTS